MRCEVGATSDINCASLGQCLRVGGFVNCQCLLFLSVILVCQHDV